MGQLLSGCSVEEQALVMEIHGSKTGIAASKAQRTESTQDLFLVLHLQSKKLLQDKKNNTDQKKIRPLGFSQHASKLTTSQAHTRNHFNFSNAKSPTTEGSIRLSGAEKRSQDENASELHMILQMGQGINTTQAVFLSRGSPLWSHLPPAQGTAGQCPRGL